MTLPHWPHSCFCLRSRPSFFFAGGGAFCRVLALGFARGFLTGTGAAFFFNIGTSLSSSEEIKRIQMEGLAIKKKFEAGQAEIAEFNLKEEALRRRTNDAANACVVSARG